MTAAEQVTDGVQTTAHPLAPGAARPVIRDHLLPVDQRQFDREVRSAEASGDPWDVLERWRTVAAIQSDREAFTAMVRRAAERLTGVPVPDDEPLEVTRRKAGM